MGGTTLANVEQCKNKTTPTPLTPPPPKPRLPSFCDSFKSSPAPCRHFSCFFFQCAVSSLSLPHGACCWGGSKTASCTPEPVVSDPHRRYWAVSLIYKLAAFGFLSVLFCARRYCFVWWRNPAKSPRIVSRTGSWGKALFPQQRGPLSSVVLVTLDWHWYFNILHSQTCLLLRFLVQDVAGIHWHSK